MKRTALITGITGQDGSHLADLLLERGYEVHGLVRPSAVEDPQRRFARIQHLLTKVKLHTAAVESSPSLFAVLSQYRFDECYHLAAQSFVAESLADGFGTLQTNIAITHALLAALQELQPSCRFYFAGTSEMFGRVTKAPQNEDTPFRPRSAYGISKLAGYHLTRNYREQHGMFSSIGILFNHEGPRRGFEFVTRKISNTAAQIKLGLATELRLGNLDARRDWGHAADYVYAMYLMLQQDAPDDFVVASGETHTVREFCDLAFAQVGLDYRDYVRVDPQFYRSAEEHPLVGDATRARKELGWLPRHSFTDLIREMVDADMARLSGAGTPSTAETA
jgi:GDPmannose 4,6-dehydratase